MNKVVVAVIAILVATAGLIYAHTFIAGSYVGTNLIFIKSTQVQAESITLSGMIIGSGQGYSGYATEEKDNALYIKLKFSVASPFNPEGTFSLLSKGDYEHIENVYLQGVDDKDARLIWSK